MSVFSLKQIVSPSRQVTLELPSEVPIGAEVTITVEIGPTWTDQELAQLLEELDTITPQSGAEIVAWLQSLPEPTGWEAIQDGGKWVTEQRRKAQENSQC
jgi:hypothetical protein